jgi:hypothetical protein
MSIGTVHLRVVVRVAANGALALAACALAACSATPTRDVPEDFSIAIVVPTPVNAGERSFAPGWVHLEPDGTLRAYAGEVTPRTRQPARVATLPALDVAMLHRELAAAGVLTYGRAGVPVGDASAATRAPGSVGVWWSAHERRRSFVLEPAAALSDDAEATRVIHAAYEKLRSAAWEDGTP